MSASEKEPSVPAGEFAEVFANLPLIIQTDLVAKLVRREPTVVGGILFPELDDPAERLDGFLDLQRELRKQAVKDAARLIRASKAPPVYPSDLETTAERLLEGTLQAPTPAVGGLLYPGRVNALYGTHTAGKTWTALYLAKLNANAGGHTLFLDYEDTEAGLAARCLALDPKLPSSVSYYAPSGVITAASLAQVIESRAVTLVVLDSTGESMAAAGYDSNSEADTTAWFTEVPDAIAALGPAVLVLDHIAKRQDGTPMPVGSFRKSAAITGAQFALENKMGFSRQRAGWSKLTCTKDRNGYFATGEVVGRMDFEPENGEMHVWLTRGEDAVDKTGPADKLEQAIFAYVSDRMDNVHGQLDDDGEEMDGRPSITQIREAVKKGGVPAHNIRIREAVDRLVENGWLEMQHMKSGKSTRDVYVPGHGGLDAVSDEEIDNL